MAVERLRLPPEIIGEIVSFASNDKQTLLSCALVCQDWLSESRIVLFRDVNISSNQAFRSFVTNVLHSEHLHPWLTSTHNMQVELFDGIRDTEPEAFFLKISECMPNLRTMGLTHSPWNVRLQVRPPLGTDLFHALGRFAFLYRLYLNNCMFTSIGEFVSVIVALPALSSLSTDRVSCLDDDGSGSDQLSTLAGSPARPALSYLSVISSFYGSTINTMYDWLANTPTRSTLRRLSLDFEDIVAGWQMIPGNSLEELTIGDMDSPAACSKIFADPRFAEFSQRLSGTEEIELLRIHADFHGISWSEIAYSLQPFASAGAVYVLRFCCCPIYYNDDDGEVFFVDLEELEPILEEGAFVNLTVMQFILFFACQDEVLPEKYEGFSGWLEYKLPSLHESVDVELYVYNAWTVLGPSGILEPLYALGGPNFPYGDSMV